MKILLLVLGIILLSNSVFAQYRHPNASSIGYRFEYNKNLQIYSFLDVQVGRNFAEGKYGIMYHWDLLPIVYLDGHTQYGSNIVTIFPLIYVFSDYINKHNSVVLKMFYHLLNVPFANFSYYLSSKSKLTTGWNTDLLLFAKSNLKKGVLFSPKLGFSYKLGLYHVNLFVKHQTFFEFNNQKRDYGIGFGVKVYSGIGL